MNIEESKVGRWKLLKWRIEDEIRLGFDKLLWRIADQCPRWLKLRCAALLMGHATTGQWGNETPGDVSIIEALRRWDIPHDEGKRTDQ